MGFGYIIIRTLTTAEGSLQMSVAEDKCWQEQSRIQHSSSALDIRTIYETVADIIMLNLKFLNK